MKKTFCDSCGEEICKNNQNLFNHYSEIAVKNINGHPLTVKIDDGDVCLHCVVDSIKKLDTRTQQGRD